MAETQAAAARGRETQDADGTADFPIRRHGRGRIFRPVMVAFHDIGAVNDNFAVGGAFLHHRRIDHDADLLDGPADAPQAVGIGGVHGCSRRRFREPVAVVNRQADVKEEMTDFRIHRGAAGHGALHPAAQLFSDFRKDDFVRDPEFEFGQKIGLTPRSQLAFFLPRLNAHDEKFFGQTAFLVHFGPEAVVDAVENAGHGNQKGGFHLGNVIDNRRGAFRQADGAAQPDDRVQFAGLTERMGPGQDGERHHVPAARVDHSQRCPRRGAGHRFPRRLRRGGRPRHPRRRQHAQQRRRHLGRRRRRPGQGLLRRSEDAQRHPAGAFARPAAHPCPSRWSSSTHARKAFASSRASV